MSEFFDTTNALKMGPTLDEFLADYPGAKRAWEIGGRIVHAHVDDVPLNVTRGGGQTFAFGWIDGVWVLITTSMAQKLDIAEVAVSVRRHVVYSPKQ